MKTDCAHSPIYDLKTGGSKCKKCGVLLNDFNQEYMCKKPDLSFIEWLRVEIEDFHENQEYNINELMFKINKKYSGVKESCNDSGGDSPLNTAHPPTSELISNLEAYAALYENLKAEYETQSSTVKNLEREVEVYKELFKAADEYIDCINKGKTYHMEKNKYFRLKTIYNQNS